MPRDLCAHPSMTRRTEITRRILLTWGRVAEGSVTPAGHCLRTLGHAGVRQQLCHRIREISPLLDVVFRVVVLGLAEVMVARAGEWNVLRASSYTRRGHEVGHVRLGARCHRLGILINTQTPDHLPVPRSPVCDNSAAPQWPVGDL